MGQQRSCCGPPAWMGQPRHHAGTSYAWTPSTSFLEREEHFRAVSSATPAAFEPPSPVSSAAGVSPEMVTRGHGGPVPLGAAPQGWERGDFPLSPRRGAGRCTGKGKMFKLA